MSYRAQRPPAIDPQREPHLKKELARHKLDLEFSGGTRSACYYIRDRKRTHYILCCFDVDVERVIRFLDAGEPFTEISLFKPSHQTEVATKNPNASYRCAVCNEPGGLPSPKMLAEARKIGVQLHDHTHLHPGRCRKSVRTKLDYARRNSTTVHGAPVQPSTGPGPANMGRPRNR